MATVRITLRMGRPRQKSIRAFTEAEEALVQKAMEIEAIDSEAQWITRAALLWARRVIAEDRGLLGKIEATLSDRGPSEERIFQPK
jgi:hypothetical protein